MSQIELVDYQLTQKFNYVSKVIGSLTNKFFRDVPPNIIITLYNIIYSTYPECLTDKYSIIEFISSNNKTLSILIDYMDNRTDTDILYRTDSTIINSSAESVMSSNKYKQIANYILYLHKLLISNTLDNIVI